MIGSPAPSGKQAATTAPTLTALAHAEAATVRLLQGSQSSYSGWGSGTVIAPDGLILTNAHVAEPQAPGLAVALGEPQSQLDPNPPYLTVELTTGPASPVKARYRARPVAVDGYLDLAVVKIYATSDGTPVNPRDPAPAVPRPRERRRGPTRPDGDGPRLPRRGRLRLHHRHQRGHLDVRARPARARRRPALRARDHRPARARQLGRRGGQQRRPADRRAQP